MTRKGSNRAKASARRRQHSTGRAYTDATRTTTAATATVTFKHTVSYGNRWEMTIPGHGPCPPVHFYPFADDAAHRIDRALDELGWQPTAQPPAGRLPEEFSLPVRRSTPRERIERREALTDDLYRRVGLGFHDIQAPYGAAVAAACTRAGLPVDDWRSDAGEPRDIVITLTPNSATDADFEDEDDDPSKLLIIWSDESAWQYAWTCSDGTNEYPEPLPAGPGSLALPDEVADAVRDFLHYDQVLPLDDAPEWQPPADYAPDARPHDQVHDDADPAFEASLATYLTHPDWTAHQEFLAAHQ